MHESLLIAGLKGIIDKFEFFIAIIDVQSGFVRITAPKKYSFLLAFKKDRHFDRIVNASSLVDIGSTEHCAEYWSAAYPHMSIHFSTIQLRMPEIAH